MKSSDFLHLTYGNPGEHTEVDSHKPFPQMWRLKPINTPVSPPGTTRARQYPRRGPFPTNMLVLLRMAPLAYFLRRLGTL